MAPQRLLFGDHDTEYAEGLVSIGVVKSEEEHETAAKMRDVAYSAAYKQKQQSG